MTGGASGIGLASVELLWQRGQRVVVADANARALEALRDRADLPLDLACLMPCDVTDEAEVERMFERAQARIGRIAGLVQSAGIGAEIPFLDTPTRTFRQVLEVNLVGRFQGAMPMLGEVSAMWVLQAGLLLCEAFLQ